MMIAGADIGVSVALDRRVGSGQRVGVDPDFARGCAEPRIFHRHGHRYDSVTQHPVRHVRPLHRGQGNQEQDVLPKAGGDLCLALFSVTV